jgi:hypothetical protein
MTIQIHPEAAKRFDEVAREILAKVAPEPELVRIGGDFRPDIHPVAQIPQRDISDFKETKSFVNGAGEEVGRLFQHGGQRVGLVGDAFKSLEDLVRRLHDAEALRESTTLEFVLDAAHSWIENTYENTGSKTFCEHILRRANEEIKDFEIWIPLHQTYIEAEIPMGPAVIRTITRQILDERFKEPVGADAENLAAFRYVNARERSRLQSCAAVSMTIRVERSKARERAREVAENSAALLRFLSPANWTPRLRSYCTPLGSENVRRRFELFMRGASLETYSSGVLDTGTGWALSKSDIALFPNVLERLHVLAANEQRTEFQQTLYNALLIYCRNSVAVGPADKLVYILVGLESVLLRNSNEPLGKNIGERMAFLIGNALDSRKAIVGNVDEIYKLRSSFIHHGGSVERIDLLSTFMLNAWTCFSALLANADRYRTRDDLIAALEERKLM